VVLLLGERLRRRTETREADDGMNVGRNVGTGDGRDVGMDTGGVSGVAVAADRRLARLSVRSAVLIGTAQVAALLPGVSRSGAAMVAGLAKGLSHADAARLSFLLATPVILAAGALKLGDLAGVGARNSAHPMRRADTRGSVR
jgi:undecaprenyl-diphosphatase